MSRFVSTSTKRRRVLLTLTSPPVFPFRECYQAIPRNVLGSVQRARKDRAQFRSFIIVKPSLEKVEQPYKYCQLATSRFGGCGFALYRLLLMSIDHFVYDFKVHATREPSRQTDTIRLQQALRNIGLAFHNSSDALGVRSQGWMLLRFAGTV